MPIHIMFYAFLVGLGTLTLFGGLAWLSLKFDDYRLNKQFTSKNSLWLKIHACKLTTNVLPKLTRLSKE